MRLWRSGDAACEKTVFAFEPIKRVVPTTVTKITASITACSVMSCLFTPHGVERGDVHECSYSSVLRFSGKGPFKKTPAPAGVFGAL